MDNKKDKIKSVLKELFNLTKKINFTDIPLKDGSILRTPDDTLVKGSKVTIVGTDGTETQVTDGDHTSQDGSTITIKSGVVDSLSAAPAPATAKMDDMPAPTTDTTAPEQSKMDVASTDDSGMDMDMLSGIINNLTERIAALEDKISNTSMTVEKMSAAPAAKPFHTDAFEEGTIGFEVEKYKKNHKNNQSRIEKQLQEFSAKRNLKKEDFTKKEKIEPKKENKQTKPFTFNLGGDFSISN